MKLPAFLSLRRMAAAEILFNALAIYWLMLLQAYFGGERESTSAAHFLLLPAMALMFWVTASKLNQVARAAAVLRQLRTPDSLWHQMTFRALRYTGLIWLFVAAGTSVQMSLPASGVPALAGAALMSLVGLLALGRSLSPSPRLVDIGLALLGLALLLGAPRDLFAWFAWFAWFGNQHVIVLFLIAISFPACLLVLGRRWSQAVPHFASRSAARARPLLDLLRAQLSRYTFIGWHTAEDGAGKSAWASPEKLLFLTIPVVLLLANPTPLYDNGQLQVTHGAVLFVIPVFLMAGLIIRDLHWRAMLLPGGLREGRLGFQIWLWTVAAQCIVLALLAMVVVLMCRFALDRSWPEIGAIVARYATLPLELACATALAVTLRALRYANMWAALVLPVGFVAVYVVRDSIDIQTLNTPLGLPLYVGGMAGVTLLLLVAANHAWTYRKLRGGK